MSNVNRRIRLALCSAQRTLSAANPEKREKRSQIFRFHPKVERMNTFRANNESNRLHLSGEFGSICFCFTAQALEWLSETTTDDSNTPIANGILFHDLLRRMRFSTGRDESFRRPQRVSAGAFQFSGIGLAAEWNMGRKRVHNLLLTMERVGVITVHSSRIASVAAVTCIMGWTDKCGNFVQNPYSRSDSSCQ